ncbi:MAG: hypothetical protein OXG16_03780 [Rhodospirillales bacterium]|nr:hypothetical protein [Rhodospirillales bacterium]MDE0711217.1 hypothetical protein [Rhodospirillales bacterium]
MTFPTEPGTLIAKKFTIGFSGPHGVAAAEQPKFREQSIAFIRGQAEIAVGRTGCFSGGTCRGFRPGALA